jgi:hypothetical protein
MQHQIASPATWLRNGLVMSHRDFKGTTTWMDYLWPDTPPSSTNQNEHLVLTLFSLVKDITVQWTLHVYRLLHQIQATLPKLMSRKVAAPASRLLCQQRSGNATMSAQWRRQGDNRTGDQMIRVMAHPVMSGWHSRTFGNKGIERVRWKAHGQVQTSQEDFG